MRPSRLRGPDVEQLFEQLRANDRLPATNHEISKPEPKGPGVVAQMAGVLICFGAFIGLCAMLYGSVVFALQELTLNSPVGN